MEPLNLKDIIDLGGQGVLLFLLWQLWIEFRRQNDRIFTYLEEARKDRHDLRTQMTAMRLSQEASLQAAQSSRDE